MTFRHFFHIITCGCVKDDNAMRVAPIAEERVC